MSRCSCHISPPCNYCMETFECSGCGQLVHPDEGDRHDVEDGTFCDKCFEKTECNPTALKELFSMLDARKQ